MSVERQRTWVSLQRLSLDPRDFRENALEDEAVKKQVRTAIAECHKWIIQHAQLICTTSRYVISSIVTQNSYHKAVQRYVHIRDEAPSELKSNAMDMAMLHEPGDNADTLVAMTLVGNDQQNKPISVEARGKICYNEFLILEPSYSSPDCHKVASRAPSLRSSIAPTKVSCSGSTALQTCRHKEVIRAM